MVEQSGIPFQAAVRIVQGKTTLNDVLQELLREEKIRRLMETHSINRALATNIALGRTDLDVVLLRRRKNQTLQEHYTQSCLEESVAKSHRLAIALHGHKKLLGKVVSIDRYSFMFLEDGTPAPVEVHKTQVKFAYDPEQYKLLRKFMGLDTKVKNLNLQPILRAKERFHFKNLALQRSIDERLEVEVTTLEGDTFKGPIEWFGRWEFGLKFKGGARVTIFRHAVYALKING
jgi:small nuclear ribonucleoprotein (snRNP)-like protein